MTGRKKYLKEDGSYDLAFAKKQSDRARQVRKYGISSEDYEAIVYAQNGRCAICGEIPESGKGKRGLHIDHDHKTGRFRALLCANCNQALGKVKENIDILWRMIIYLRRWKEPL